MADMETLERCIEAIPGVMRQQAANTQQGKGDVSFADIGGPRGGWKPYQSGPQSQWSAAEAKYAATIQGQFPNLSAVQGSANGAAFTPAMPQPKLVQVLTRQHDTDCVCHYATGGSIYGPSPCDCGALVTVPAQLPRSDIQGIGWPTRCVNCGLPLSDGKCARCFPAKTMPSRDMLIRQAILNWLNVHMPMCVKEFGAVETLRRSKSLWNDPLYFGRGVRQHFAALVDKYGEPKCPSF